MSLQFLMCSPEFYNIEYEINPWMDKSKQANNALAVQQWKQLYTTIKQCGAEIFLVPPVKHLPDLVFTANAAMFLPDKKVYLSHFRYPERQGERKFFRQWFEKQGYLIMPDNIDEKDLIHQRPYFEGAGDGLYCGDTLFAAYGFRTDKEAFDQVKQHGVKNIIYCELKDPYFYHLDTCFCPIDKERAIWWPDAFTPESQQRMQREKELIVVPAEDTQHFACNAVVINKNIIIPSGCNATKKLLKQLGMTVYECPMTEYIKAGGACKCLTLQLA